MIEDEHIHAVDNPEHTTNFCPQNARLNTARLYGWKPFITDFDSSPSTEATIKLTFPDFVTIDALDIQQGDITGDPPTSSNRFLLTSDSYWNPGTLIPYSKDESAGSSKTHLVLS